MELEGIKEYGEPDLDSSVLMDLEEEKFLIGATVILSDSLDYCRRRPMRRRQRDLGWESARDDYNGGGVWC